MLSVPSNVPIQYARSSSAIVVPQIDKWPVYDEASRISVQRSRAVSTDLSALYSLYLVLCTNSAIVALLLSDALIRSAQIYPG